MDTHTLTDAFLSDRSIEFNYEQMPNTELRFRLLGPDGGCYVRTEASPEGSWQNSHSHDATFELYVIQAGWIAIAHMGDIGVEINVYRENDHCVIRPHVLHNVYMPARAVLHTVKYGGVKGDWIACEELDKLTQHLSEQDILASARERHPNGGA